MASSVRQIIVDDSDPRITYSGSSWTADTTGLNDIGTYGPIYNGTSHGTTSFQSLTFTFNGTTISTYGTNKLKLYPNNTSSPGFECLIDQNTVNVTGASFDPQNNWDLCDAKGLSADIEHTLTIRVATYADTWWLDYLRYTPVLNATFPSDKTPAVYVQSNDEGLKYKTPAEWQTFAGFNSVEPARYTRTPGEQLTFSFVGKSFSSFSQSSLSNSCCLGTKVAWYGWLLVNSPHNIASGSYSVDGSVAGNFDFGNTPAVNVTHPNALFFSTPDLPFDLHTLVVTYNGGPGNAPSPLSLGYLILTGTSITSAIPSAPPGISSSPLSSPTSTSTSTPQPSTPAPPVGAIVGGVVGGLALIALALLCLWWWRRRKVAEVEQPPSGPMVQPFMLSEQLLPPVVVGTTSGKGLPPYTQHDYIAASGSDLANGSGSAPRTKLGSAGSASVSRDRLAAGWGGSNGGLSSEYVPMEIRKPPLGDVKVRPY
ncbi:hypothetical protein DXG01_010030 [Tephrocybe rancida]|nr:hypothetical protein DXG01_010030 [Tephrocybe rancida]